MISTATLDIRDLVTGTGAFGPTDIRNLLESLGSDAAAHRDLRLAVQELEGSGERSPAASVRLGVCQYLLGRAHDALETLKSGDGSALALFYQGLAHATLGNVDAAHYEKARESFANARKAGYDATACDVATAETLRASGLLDEAGKALERIEKQDGSADYWALKGSLLAEQGGVLGDTVAALEKAIALDEGHPAALFTLGVINDRLGNDDEAKKMLRAVAQAIPGHGGRPSESRPAVRGRGRLHQGAALLQANSRRLP